MLDALAQDFIDHKFDVKHMIRTIVNSRVYQLVVRADGRQQARPAELRPLLRPAADRRSVADAVDQACGTQTQFSGVSDNARAVDLPHEGFGSYFLDTFDRPQRVTGCECERSTGATLAQVLLLANSDEIENKLADGEGRIAAIGRREAADAGDDRGAVPGRAVATADRRRAAERRWHMSKRRRTSNARHWKMCCGRC